MEAAIDCPKDNIPQGKQASKEESRRLDAAGQSC